MARSLVIGVMVALCCMLAATVPNVLTETDAAPSVALAAADSGSDELEIATLDELDGKRVGVISGGVADKLVTDNLDGTYDFRYFNSPADAIAALRAGKVDGYCSDKPVCQLAVSRYDGIGIVPEPITESDYGLFFREGSPLAPKFSEVIGRMEADGTLEALKAKWCGADEAAKTMPDQTWDAPNGTLVMATSGTQEPLTYVRGTEIVGYDIEVAALCCRELGYRLETQSQNIAGALAAVAAGKADLGGGGISITEEREETVDFTVPDYDGALMVVVRTKEDASATGLAHRLATSFRKTFIDEGRWQLFTSGLVVTITISVCAGALGVLLGYATVLARRNGARWVGKIVDGYRALMGGVPIVVVLMVLYYVVFGSVDIAGEIVSIMAFTLSFGATAGSTMQTAIAGIDEVQEESGLALGYTEHEVFSKIIFPQARQMFTPQLMGQFVGLVKETSIVGYIAVQDLTRASDLIRARTMDAFFPLISTAIIYFLICRLLAWVLARIAARLDVTNRPREIKGI